MPAAAVTDMKGLVRLAAKGDDHALAELLTQAEDQPACQKDIERALPERMAMHVIGLTGPPGCGKSTLTDKLITCFRRQERSVGMIGVDPTSPTTGGAILGDRVRMSAHFTDRKVFIRSMASRGELGGVAKATALAARILAISKEIVLVETVGVGQLEVNVRGIVDTLCVVLTPASGDDIQFMKAGLMEVADIFVLNKAEDPKSDKVIGLVKEYVNDQFHGKSWMPPVVSTVALENRGVDELMEHLAHHQRFLRGSHGR